MARRCRSEAGAAQGAMIDIGAVIDMGAVIDTGAGFRLITLGA